MGVVLGCTGLRARRSAGSSTLEVDHCIAAVRLGSVTALGVGDSTLIVWGGPSGGWLGNP